MLRGIDEAGFLHPTDIQDKLIPLILEGRDVLGQAKTGTGKTATFGLPLLSMVDPEGGVQAMILAPTRELAAQIVTELDELGKHTKVRSAAIVGGERYQKQISALNDGVQIVVGTPGRVIDLHQKHILNYDTLRHVVLDEVDRMLDIGFRDDIRKILAKVKGDHQTIFVSATISDDIERLARQFMKPDAEKIVTAAKSLTVSQVTQHHIPVNPWDKDRLCAHLLKQLEPALTVIFCRTKRKVDKLTLYLNREKIDAHAIHGDLSQANRNKMIQRLRDNNLEVLVASDLASRGLDVEGITHVINYDLPDDIENYVHRIGRTARAGRSGDAWAFVQPDQGQLLTEIEKLTGVLIDKLEVEGFEAAPRPDNWRDEPKGGRYTPDAPKAPPAKSRYESDHNLAQPDPNLFPGGIVPKGPAKKSLGSKFSRRRR